jgi:hypothetical protein
MITGQSAPQGRGPDVDYGRSRGLDTPGPRVAGRGSSTLRRRRLAGALAFTTAVIVAVGVWGRVAPDRLFDETIAYDACRRAIEHHGGTVPNPPDQRVALQSERRGKAYSFDIAGIACAATEQPDGLIRVTGDGWRDRVRWRMPRRPIDVNSPAL